MRTRVNLKVFASMLVIVMALSLVMGCGPEPTPTPQPSPTVQVSQPEPTKPPEAPTPTSPPAISGEVTVAIVEDWQTMDPHQHTNLSTYQIHDHIFDRLVELSPDNEFLPVLAESWSNPDPNTWIFNLRQGIKFHNGEEFTSESVKVTLLRYLEDIAKPYAQQYWVDLETVETPDKYTAVVRTKQPVATMLSVLTLAHMIPPEGSKDPEFFDKPAGTGPFKIVEWIKGDRLVLEANEDYWREGMPKLAKLTWRIIIEDTTRMSALKAGEVDIVEHVPPEQVKEIQDTPGLDVNVVPTIMTRYVGFNNEREPFNNRLVRLALNYAVNKQAIIDALFLGYAIPPDGECGPGTLYRNEDLEPYSYDPTKAKELLAEAGYPDGFEMELQALGGTAPRTLEELQMMQADFAAIGVEATINVPEHAAARALRTEGKYDMSMSQSSNLTRHAGPWLWLTYGPGNFRRYNNEEFNALVTEANSTTDTAKQEELLKKAQEIVWNDVPDVMLYFQTARYGINTRMQGALYNPTRTVDLRNAYVAP